MKKLLLLIGLAVAIIMPSYSVATTYTWKGGASGEYSLSTNWSPARTTPAIDDILIFDMANRDGVNGVGTITANNITNNQTIGELKIISSANGATAGVKTTTFGGTAATLNITGDLTIAWYASSNYSRLADGGCTINISGNFQTLNAQGASSTYHQGAGKIVFNGTTQNFMSAPTATSGNGGFTNIEIASTSTLTLGSTMAISGNLKINGNLSLNAKTLSMQASTGVGGTFDAASSGKIIGHTSSSVFISGTGPSSGTQTVGTINFDNTSAAGSSVNGLTIERTNATTTIGTCYSNTLTMAGAITLTAGTIDDGGNTLTCAGGTLIIVGSASTGTGKHMGTGKLSLIRTTAVTALVTAAKTVSVGNIEISSGSGALSYPIAASTNLTINGTLTLNKSGASIANSGTINIASTGGVQIIAGSITGTSPTYTSGSTLTYNTGGAISSTTVEFPNSFPANIAVQSGTLTLDAAKTVTGTTTISSGATLATPITYTANGNVSCPGTFQINQGGYAAGTGVWDYSTTGTLAFNNSSGSYGINAETFWPSSNGPVNVSVLGAGGITMNVARTVSGLIQTAATITNANNLTVNGTLQINNGGGVSAAPVYGSSSILKYNSGTTYGRYKELDTTTPASIQLSNNTTLNYPNGTSVTRTLTGNLTIDAGSSLYMDYGTIGMNQPLTVNGNVTINGNLSLGDGVGGDLIVGGNWTRAASGSTFNTNSREVKFNGTGAQSISRTGGETFAYLTVNKSANTLTSNVALTINNDLNLSAGTLADGGNTITVSGNVLGSGIHTGAGKISMTGSAKTISGATFENLTLNNAGGFSLDGSPTINGTLTLTAGSFAVGANTLTLNGPTFAGTATNLSTTSSSSLVFGGTSAALSLPSSVTALNNLTLNNANATLTVGANHSIAGDLSLTAGTLADNAKTITLSGNILGTGTHSGSGKISMTGSGKTISAVTGLGNLDINTTGTISATAAIPINGNLSFSAAGTLADGGYTITVGGNISGTIGTHTSTGLGKLKMIGDGKSFTANTYGNFEIAGGTSISPISSSGGANFASGSTFTVASGYYFNAALNTMQFGATGGTVNIYGTASTTRGNGFFGSFNSVFGWNNTTYPSGITGLSVNFNNGSTAVYNSTTSQTVSTLTYHHLTVTGARASGVLSFSNNIQVNGDFTFDATQGGTTTITSPSSTTFTFGGSGTQNVSFSGLGANSGTSAINFFNLAINSSSNVVSNVDIPVAGSLSGTGSFSNASTKITMTGSTKNISGLSISNLEVNSAGTITTTAAPTISGTLSLTSGTLSNTTNGLTLGNGATIVRTNGTLTASPTFGASANLTYNGSSSVSSGNELPTSSSVLNTLTVNNTAGVSIGANTTAENLAINASGILNVATGKQLTVSTTMTNNGTLNLLSTSGGGTATILTPVSISGTNTANVEQYLASSRNWYMASPVTGATASAGPTYYKYVEALNNGTTWTPVNSGDTYALMTGYIVKPTSATTYNFNGTLNTGNKTISGLTSTATAKTGFNLVGNPYPSYVKWSEAVRTNVENTMWYRTHNGTNYKFYTYQIGVGAGGIGVPATVTDYIPPMQAFWVKVTTGQTGSVQFLNSSRDHQDGAGSVFRAPKATASEMKLLRLQVSNATDNDETVLYFNANASDNLDGYDSQKMFNNNAAIPEIYTTASAEKLVINGMNDVKYDTEIPLGFVSGQTNSFSIKATELKNFEAGTRIILRDKVDVVDYELNGDNAYTFTSDAVNSTSRFSLLFKSPSIPTDIADAKNSNVYAFVNANNNIVIAAPEKTTYSIYNSVGMLIENGKTTAKLQTANCKLQTGVYMVNVNNQTTKVIIK